MEEEVMNRLITALALAAAGVGSLMPACAAAQIVPAPIGDPKVSALIESFFTQLKAGQMAKAADAIYVNWKLPPVQSQRTELLVQVSPAISRFGAVQSWERLGSSVAGTLFERRTYLVQHDFMVTRWEFIFVRSGRGWIPGDIAVATAVKGWPRP
jgi:hypothetical protein